MRAEVRTGVVDRGAKATVSLRYANRAPGAVERRQTRPGHSLAMPRRPLSRREQPLGRSQPSGAIFASPVTFLHRVTSPLTTSVASATELVMSGVAALCIRNALVSSD